MFRSFAIWISILFLCLPHSSAEEIHPSLTVFAAASLSEAFQEIRATFEKREGISVKFNFAGSQQLAAQIEHGADADLFASADERWMNFLSEKLLLAGKPVSFARNQLVVIFPKKNRVGIKSLQDLAKPGVKLVLAAQAVPVGKYSREMFAKLSKMQEFERDYGSKVLKNVVSEEEDVKAIVSKISIDEADAGVVYATDVTSKISESVATFAIPDRANVTALYPISVLKSTRQQKGSQAFLDFVASGEGQKILKRRGFLP